jgi:hypothetical protein
MTRPKLDTLLFVTWTASTISFALSWLGSLVGRIGLAVAIVAFVVAIATTTLAIVVHRTRGLWAILAAVPALFWPAVISIAKLARFMAIVTDAPRMPGAAKQQTPIVRRMGLAARSHPNSAFT